MRNLDYISVARLMAMMGIVIFHCCCYNLGFWSDFESPVQRCSYMQIPVFLRMTSLALFFFISGYLYGNLFHVERKYAELNKTIVGKAYRLLCPYLCWTIVMYLCFSHLSVEEHTFFYYSYHLWFLLSLFLQFIFVIAYSRICNSSKFHDFIVGGCLLLSEFFIPYYLGYGVLSDFEETFYFFPMFFWAYLAGKYDVINKSSDRLVVLCRPISILLTILVYATFFLPVFPMKSLIRVCLLIILCISLLISMKNMRLGNTLRTYVSCLDHYSMGIYILHHIILFAILCIACVRSFASYHCFFAPFVLFVIVFPLSLAGAFVKEKLHIQPFL